MADAFLTSYYSLYFIHRGMDSMQQAILLAVIPFSLFLGCMALSWLAKTRRRALWIFRGCTLIEAGFVIGYAFLSDYASLLAFTAVLGFFNGAPFALIEGYIVPELKAKGGNYSTVRMFGSLGYIVSLAIGYFFLGSFPLEYCYFLSGGFFLTALGLSFLLRESRADPLEQAPEEPEEAPAKGKFITRALVLFWLSQFFFYGAFNTSSYLLPVRLKELGFLDQDYSLARSVAVVVELLFLLLIPWVCKNFRHRKSPLFISACFIVFATSIAAFSQNPWVLGYTNLVLSHMGKAFLFAFQAIWLETIVGKQALGKALTVNTGAINLSSAVLNFSSGPLHQLWGFQGYFRIAHGFGGRGGRLAVL